MKDILRYNKFQYIFLALILLSVALSIFTPNLKILLQYRDYSVHLLLAMLLLGIVFHLLDKPNLMLISFAGAFILALFLRSSSSDQLNYHKPNGLPSISLEHYNLQNLTPTALTKILNSSKSDVISLQEFTPYWENYLQGVNHTYQHTFKLTRVDPEGKVLLSKFPLHHKDTLHEADMVLLAATVDKDSDFRLVSIYQTPILDEIKGRSPLLDAASDISNTKDPLIAFGDYNQSYWSSELIQFREKIDLLNSRRQINVFSLKIPYDHIFYSGDMECTLFEEIYNDEGQHIGIRARLQLIPI